MASTRSGSIVDLPLFVRYVALLVLSAVLAGAQATGKKSQSDPVLTFKADTKLVVLHTSVLDKEEHFVTNLSQGAF